MLQNRLAQLREKRANDDNGFTLIELLVVVVIIGILIAIAIPLYLNYQKGANDKAAQSDLRNAIATLETCNSDNGNYPSAVTFPTTGNKNAVSPTGCSAQTINKTAATTLTYITNAGGTAYALQAYSSSGNTSSSSYYCYASVAGGSVVKSANTFATATNVGTTFTC